MIANDQELQSVLRQLQELRLQRDRLLHDSGVNPFQLHIEVSGLEKMLARLQDEVDASASIPSQRLTTNEPAAV